MRPTTSRDFQNLTAQRFITAEFLLNHMTSAATKSWEAKHTDETRQVEELFKQRRSGRFPKGGSGDA